MNEESYIMRTKKEVPIWEKALLTLNEASAYTGIGINRLRIIASHPHNNLVIWVGSKKMIKRKKLEEYLDKTYSI